MSEVTIAENVYTDYSTNSFVFKYYNQFFKYNKYKKSLKPISESKVNDLVPIHKISIEVNNIDVNSINAPITFVKEKGEYGVIIDKVSCIDQRKVVISIKLLSSYFGVNNIVEKTMNLSDIIEILSFKLSD